MRLHQLQLQAFGPFAGVESVDFDALGDAGIFLLHGQTGAGKTSILDAVCFAVFGTVPGARAQAARLRSDHAPADLPTEVRLEVTVRGRRFRFVRRPAWERAKRRGAGTTTEQARVVVEEQHCGAATVVSTRLDETGAFVRALFGMTAEQFCQVVLLPQGRFADFLRADAESRRPLLEQLFGTERFSVVERYLVERRQRAWRELEAANVGLTALLARIAQVAGVEPPVMEETADENGAAAWAGSLHAHALREADTAQAHERRCAAELTASRQALESATRLAQAQQRYARALTEHDGLRAGAADRTELAALLEAATRATALLPLLQDADDAAREHQGAQTADAQSRAALPGSLREAGAARLRAHAQRLREELAELEVAREEERQARRLAAEAEAARIAAAAASRAASRGRAELARLPEARDLAQAAVLEAQRGAHVLEDRRAEHQRLSARAVAAHAYAGLQGELAAVEAALRSATDTAQEARERWLDARQSRLDGMAGELAAGLSEGAPCPVCGSCAHPVPAVTSESGADAEEEQEAERWATQAEAHRRATTETLTELREALARAGALAGSGDSAEELSLAARLAQEEACSAEMCAASLQQRRAALDLLCRRESELLEEVRRHDVAAADAGASLSHLQTTSEQAHRRVIAACGGHPGIDSRRRALEEELARVEEAGTARDACSVAQVAAERAQRRVTDAAATAGFTCLAALREALQPAEVTARWRLLLDDAKALLRGAEAVLADEDLQAAHAAPAPDVAELQATLQRRERERTDAAVRRGAADAAVVALEQLTLDLEERLSVCEPLRESYALAHRLAGLAEGTSADNTLRMRLSAYVLAARLEQVATAASERLARMSSGRYTLVHTDEGSNGRKRAGLGLRVIDAWTGIERDPSTLSGGETFAASLALALGLADVATAEAGGILIDTLLIDEGFGTLDGDSLEEVMDVLDSLREGGRIVGVVSHVAELRARIPAQVEVRKHPDGSSITQTGADAVGPGPEVAAQAPERAAPAAAGRALAACSTASAAA